MNRPPSFIALILVALTALPAMAGETLETVKSRGVLRCGVSEGIAGFSQPDADGRWQGLDADFCRAVAAAVLGDGERVEFVPLQAAARFPALLGRKIDLLSRTTTWTLNREAILGLQFPAIIFYDGQGFLVPAAAGIQSPSQLHGKIICLEKGTNHERNLARYAYLKKLNFTPLVLDSLHTAADALFAGRCAAYTGDAGQLAATRLRAPGGADAFVILPERISKEPLAPVILEGDGQWTTVIRWVLFSLIRAEEYGVTRDNVDALFDDDTATLGRQFAFLTKEEKRLLGNAMSLTPGWAMRAIKTVGNYGEIYERHLGRASPLHIERGLNRLWTEGGLMYAPPPD